MFPQLLFILSQLVVHIHPYGILSANKPDIEVNVHVERDAHNRGLLVEVIGEEGGVAASQRELEGEKASTMQKFTFKRLPEGKLAVWATLIRWEDGKWKYVKEKGENLEVR